MTGAGEQLIPGPAGALQVLVESPAVEAGAVAVICHPHPLHGGTLKNKVVHQLARAFLDLGAISVRFNFRGVGDSEGRYDEGRGEFDDLLAVVAWARQQWPRRRLWLAGFSFGGFIALRGAIELNPDWLVSVAPAVNYFPAGPSAAYSGPWLLIQGDADDVVPPDRVFDWLRAQDYQPNLALLKGAGHFFHGRLNELRQVVNRAGRDLLPDTGLFPGEFENI